MKIPNHPDNAPVPTGPDRPLLRALQFNGSYEDAHRWLGGKDFTAFVLLWTWGEARFSTVANASWKQDRIWNNPKLGPDFLRRRFERVKRWRARAATLPGEKERREFFHEQKMLRMEIARAREFYSPKATA